MCHLSPIRATFKSGDKYLAQKKETKLIQSSSAHTGGGGADYNFCLNLKSFFFVDYFFA